ncbi:MAG: TatD family hydrolase [Planctomycetota bacterium]|jgi:TatD family hydrolase|nr:TatD family hydrolase [Planctomycetota bacterium]
MNRLRWTDTHCHLDQIEDPQKALEDALTSGVERIVAVSEGPESIESILHLGSRYPDRILVGLGIHPVSAVRLSREVVEETLQTIQARLPEAQVLGEVGLDHKWATDESSQTWQLEVLRRQLDWAAHERIPANFHSRRCERAVMNEAIRFHQETGLGAQLHWFTHSKKLIRITNDAGIFISVGPRILDCDETQKVVPTIDMDLLLLETDSPVPFGGKSARPEWIHEVGHHVAQLLGIDVTELSIRTEANFDRYLSMGRDSKEVPR